ncbi:helix-turn-helix domain-containing protein [Sphingomonas sp. 28-63-12]|uniref:helix-turn-helix domain-containing protein n=1 Tax=Sphingomonas sp. 28-63-12 TaxID=1970434 RepID=UPI000BD4A540|nr:MAG: hypothetical protein B7Y47_06180 [Sphingomonas sp. 28-63-12]
MTDSDPGEEASLFPKTAGERLREYREAQGLTLAEVAARTRVPIRHLEAIEQSNYAGLPSHTYSVGFAKAYARAIGMDEVPIARDVRSQADLVRRPPEYQPYEMQDPRRLPPRGVAMAGAVVAVLVLIAVGLWYGTTLFRGDGQPAPAVASTERAPAPVVVAPPAPAAPANGQVTLTATDVVWLRVYDADGKSLFENELKAGERYEVPADANRPMINVGRPDKLQVTVNGSSVPPLGDGARAIKDVEITAQALLARGTATTPAASPAATAAAPTTAPATAVVKTAAPRPPRPLIERSSKPPVVKATTPAAAPTALLPQPVPSPTTGTDATP